MSNKPDWEDAPEWAMWLAQDKPGDGECWVWFACEPKIFNDGWMQTNGGWRQIKSAPAFVDEWMNTLEPRP